LIVLAPDFITKICKKGAQHFHFAVSKVFDRVKSVAYGPQISGNWPRTIRATVPQLHIYMLYRGFKVVLIIKP
jgi:hypothetical protein